MDEYVPLRPRCRGQAGFTWVELMISIAVAAILSAIALPAYTAYMQRSHVPSALDALSSYHVRMQQHFQEKGSYGAQSCALVAPQLSQFTVTCNSSGGGFVVKAQGSGPMSGYGYAIDHLGTRTTLAHPDGTPAAACWSRKGKACDS